jgi:predicted transcriptional regulator
MKQLTKAEEEVMHILWQLEKTNVAGIIKQLPAPKPAYNTVSTIVRILESKGFVDHEQEGKGYLYFPIVKKTDYSNHSMHKLVDNYFQGSFKSMVSFYMKKNDISLQELEEILKEINNKKE